ncbi:MAG: peptidylprolyl isomerase [Clostridia bacterium]
MKKLLWILLALGLVFVAVVGLSQKPAKTPAPAVEDETIYISPVNPEPPTTSVPEAPEAAPLRHVDLERLHALYPEDSVYATIGEREITWGEYYEWLGTYILSAEQYMESMASYGMASAWDSPYAEGVSLGDYVIANLNDNLRAFTGIDAFAARCGVEVGEEDLAAKKAEDKSAMLGPDAGDEEWAALLVQNFLTENIYLAQAKANLELTRSLDALYGENGEKLSDEALQKYIEDKEYLRCNHILFLTIDTDSFEALDEETIAAKKSRAEEIAAELQSIENREELLARFAELKEELDEDTGKLYYPEGYLFTPGQMVEAFEETTRALAPFEVSAPVLSEYGYHIIIRLPIDADTVTDSGSTIGAAAASEIMADDLDQVVDALDFSLVEGKEPVDLLQFLIETADK